MDLMRVLAFLTCVMLLWVGNTVGSRSAVQFTDPAAAAGNPAGPPPTATPAPITAIEPGQRRLTPPDHRADGFLLSLTGKPPLALSSGAAVSFAATAPVGVAGPATGVGDIRLLRTDAWAASDLGVGAQARMSPDGTTAAWLTDTGVMLATTTDSATRSIPIAAPGTLTWSPDSARLAVTAQLPAGRVAVHLVDATGDAGLAIDNVRDCDCAAEAPAWDLTGVWLVYEAFDSDKTVYGYHVPTSQRFTLSTGKYPAPNYAAPAAGLPPIALVPAAVAAPAWRVDNQSALCSGGGALRPSGGRPGGRCVGPTVAAAWAPDNQHLALLEGMSPRDVGSNPAVATPHTLRIIDTATMNEVLRVEPLVFPPLDVEISWAPGSDALTWRILAG